MWGILLRPKEDLVPGKTGEYDEAIIIDTDLWLHPFLEQLVAARGRGWRHASMLSNMQEIDFSACPHLMQVPQARSSSC